MTYLKEKKKQIKATVWPSIISDAPMSLSSIHLVYAGESQR